MTIDSLEQFIHRYDHPQSLGKWDISSLEVGEDFYKNRKLLTLVDTMNFDLGNSENFQYSLCSMYEMWYGPVPINGYRTET